MHVHITVNQNGANSTVGASAEVESEAEGDAEHGFHSHFVDPDKMCCECGTLAKRNNLTGDTTAVICPQTNAYGKVTCQFPRMGPFDTSRGCGERCQTCGRCWEVGEVQGCQICNYGICEACSRSCMDSSAVV